MTVGHPQADGRSALRVQGRDKRDVAASYRHLGIASLRGNGGEGGWAVRGHGVSCSTERKRNSTASSCVWQQKEARPGPRCECIRRRRNGRRRHNCRHHPANATPHAQSPGVGSVCAWRLGGPGRRSRKAACTHRRRARRGSDILNPAEGQPAAIDHRRHCGGRRKVREPLKLAQDAEHRHRSAPPGQRGWAKGGVRNGTSSESGVPRDSSARSTKGKSDCTHENNLYSSTGVSLRFPKKKIRRGSWVFFLGHGK